MANEKRLIYLEDAIALLEKDVVDSKDALKTAYYGDKDVIRAEMNGVRAAIHILKHHASHGGTVDAVEMVHGHWTATDVIVHKAGYGVRYYYHAECKVNPHRLFECENDYCPNCGAKMDGGNEDA